MILWENKEISQLYSQIATTQSHALYQSIEIAPLSFALDAAIAMIASACIQFLRCLCEIC